MSDSAIHLIGLAAGGANGPLWGTETQDLDCTFLVWHQGEGVPEHVNSEVDVAMIVLSGSASVCIEGQASELGEGMVVVIPKGTSRGIQAGAAGVAYVNVHRRRRGLTMSDPSDRDQLQRHLPRS